MKLLFEIHICFEGITHIGIPLQSIRFLQLLKEEEILVHFGKELFLIVKGNYRSVCELEQKGKQSRKINMNLCFGNNVLKWNSIYLILELI